jgi:hypothetical protein
VFSGREQALAQALETAHRPGNGLRVLAVDGMPGVGKTAFAIHFARQVAAEFPDGWLYADLGERAAHENPADPADPGEVLLGFLENLGLDRQRLPTSTEAKSALFRSVLSGRRMVVVLDNVFSAEQVRPLLPGTPECMAVMTSRSRLINVVAAHGARPLSLDLPSASEAAESFLRRLGRVQSDVDMAAIEEIVTRCGRLPLALAVVADRAANRRERSLAGLAAELAASQESLEGFSQADGTNPLRSAFHRSYRTLGNEAKQMFRRLHGRRSADVSGAELASAAGVSPAAAVIAIGELMHARLLEFRSGDKYSAHNLVLTYASELASDRLDITFSDTSALVEPRPAWQGYDTHLTRLDIPVMKRRTARYDHHNACRRLPQVLAGNRRPEPDRRRARGPRTGPA